MIPKVIHYAWFGRGAKPALAIKCIESWKKILPDYKIIEWNEDNFDMSLYPFVKEAYQAKKYAYVTDVVRLYVLYQFGGIYMDSDVEVVKSLDDLLELHGFSGFQTESTIPTGILASEKGNLWIKEQLDYYEGLHFNLEDVNQKQITNVDIITNISLNRHGLNPNNTHQILKYDMEMFPFDYFCAKRTDTGIICRTENTYTIHHFAGSWTTKKARRNKKIFQIIARLFGEKNARNIHSILKKRGRNDQENR